MYVFTSAVFFLVFFSLKNDESIVTLNDNPNGKTNPKNLTAAQVIKKLESKRNELKESVNDSIPGIAKMAIMAAIAKNDSDIALLKRDTTAKDRVNISKNNNVNLFSGTKNNQYNSIAGYDSAQKKLPESERDNFIERKFTHQNIHLREKYHDDKKAMWEAILEKFKHLFPQMLFVSLPLFAFLLQLLYVRRKNFFYVNHVVFTIHLYCGTFIIILVALLLDALLKKFGYHNQTIGLLFMLTGFFYWYKSMRNFYEQRRAKTVLKYLLVMFLSIFLMSILFTVFFFFSAMAI